MELHVVAIPEDRNKKPSRSSNSDRDIDVISSDDFSSINDGVDNRIFEESLSCCLQEEGHESELNVVLFQEFLA